MLTGGIVIARHIAGAMAGASEARRPGMGAVATAAEARRPGVGAGRGWAEGC